jgi:hypothetical protein
VTRFLIGSILLALIAAPSLAVANPIDFQPPRETAELKQGPGVQSAKVCLTCHSADYVSTQPAEKGKAFWEAEVQKMIKVYKAPVAENDVAAIVEYLASTY